MKTGLFKLFVQMIGDIPDAEILKAVELEQGMLESHLMYKSILETPEVNSILCFCQFIGAATDDDGFIPVELPAKHIAFYQTVVMRLVESGQMPSQIKEKFDFTFKPAGCVLENILALAKSASGGGRPIAPGIAQATAPNHSPHPHTVAVAPPPPEIAPATNGRASYHPPAKSKGGSVRA
jgi:hypothetical protein